MKKKLAMSMAAILSLALLASCGGKKAAETTAKAEETSSAKETAKETEAESEKARKAVPRLQTSGLAAESMLS